MMTPADLNELQAAHDAYHGLLNQHYGELHAAALNLIQRLRFASSELAPEESAKHRPDFRWIFFTDDIRVESRDDALVLEFWENGRCGNTDECNKTLPLTVDLLTDGGRQAWVANWLRSEQTKAKAIKEQQAQQAARRIQELEAELALLKKNSA